MKPMRLHLILKHKYYKEIAEGNKKVEFRRNIVYWRKRIVEKWDSNGGNVVIFHKGYTNITMTFKVGLLVLGQRMIELHLGERTHFCQCVCGCQNLVQDYMQPCCKYCNEGYCEPQ